MRATEKRIEELRAKQTAPERAPLVVGDATMTWDKDENRVRLTFPGKPAAEAIAALKGNGFRWAPSVGAWQRQASEGAWFAGERILRAGGVSA